MKQLQNDIKVVLKMLKLYPFAVTKDEYQAMKRLDTFAEQNWWDDDEYRFEMIVGMRIDE